jgi:hypothetical protein
VYALVAQNVETLQQIPCYCGCRRSEGHQRVVQCHIKRRSAGGQVVEWHPHGRMCPLGADIAGDTMLWHRHGESVEEIRSDVELEYSSREPVTPTPSAPNP